LDPQNWNLDPQNWTLDPQNIRDLVEIKYVGGGGYNRPKTNKKALKKEFKTVGIKLPMSLCFKCGWKL
jgi:hypothetical protein